MVVIGILSGKGGVGKTTVSTNLAIALSREFKRNVILLDSNLSSAHVGLHFGVYEELENTLPDLLKQKKEVDLDKSVYSHNETGVNIIPSSMSIHDDVNLKKLKNLVRKLAKSPYDFVLMDAAPGFGPDMYQVINSADEILVVTTPNIPDVSDAVKITELLKKMKKKITGIVLNRVTEEKYELGMEELRSTFNAPIIAVVPEDKRVPESISLGMPVVTYEKFSKASIALKKLAAKIAGEKYKRPSVFARVADFFSATPKPEKRRVSVVLKGTE